jgi:hypothetical protein
VPGALDTTFCAVEVTCCTADGGGDPPFELLGWGEGLELELAGAG